MSEKAKILIVDDDRDLVAVMRMVLQKQGYRVVDAPGPAEGLGAVEAERPDLILLDVMMPNATEGFHFVWTLRQKPGAYYREVPIVILSAIHSKTDLRFYPDSSDGSYRAGEYLPVQEFLDKPVDPTDLLSVVARRLDLVRKG
jgi:CheY-like chemotaxis protein